jgi:hypothetical protein
VSGQTEYISRCSYTLVQEKTNRKVFNKMKPCHLSTIWRTRRQKQALAFFEIPPPIFPFLRKRLFLAVRLP